MLKECLNVTDIPAIIKLFLEGNEQEAVAHTKKVAEHITRYCDSKKIRNTFPNGN